MLSGRRKWNSQWAVVARFSLITQCTHEKLSPQSTSTRGFVLKANAIHTRSAKAGEALKSNVRKDCRAITEWIFFVFRFRRFGIYEYSAVETTFDVFVRCFLRSWRNSPALSRRGVARWLEEKAKRPRSSRTKPNARQIRRDMPVSVLSVSRKLSIAINRDHLTIRQEVDLFGAFQETKLLMQALALGASWII